MAEIRSQAKIEGTVTLVLTEQEARALYNITGYGHEHFTKWFYKNLGRYYLEPHHNGLVSLFDTIQANIPPHLKRFDEARKVFNQSKR